MLNPKEIAQALSVYIPVTDRTVRRWAERRVLKAKKIRGRWFFAQEYLDKLISRIKSDVFKQEIKYEI